MVKNPDWQCVLICWGTKYAKKDIVPLTQRIARFAATPPRFILITDRVRDLPDYIEQRCMPEFYNQPVHQGRGCQAKLCMFQKGVVPDDLPAIFVDLDTVILGDISKAFTFHDPKQTIQLLQSAILPFSIFARGITRITKGKRYARGNSSIVVFHPKYCHAIDEKYREVTSHYPNGGFKPATADERFISWSSAEKTRALPNSFAVKFPTEYMLHTKWLTLLKARLPFAKKRRAGLCAITLPGEVSKSESILSLQDGQIIRDNKGRYLIWTDAALGPMRSKLIEYAEEVSQRPDI